MLSCLLFLYVIANSLTVSETVCSTDGDDEILSYSLIAVACLLTVGPVLHPKNVLIAPDRNVAVGIQCNARVVNPCYELIILQLLLLSPYAHELLRTSKATAALPMNVAVQ